MDCDTLFTHLAQLRRATVGGVRTPHKPLLLLTAGITPAGTAGLRRIRRSGFAEEVLRAYAYACAVCGFDGGLGRNSVALQAAHIHWHSQGGPDAIPNGLALCVLHHALLDLGVIGITTDRAIKVSSRYVPRGTISFIVTSLHGQPLRQPQQAARQRPR